MKDYQTLSVAFEEYSVSSIKNEDLTSQFNNPALHELFGLLKYCIVDQRSYSAPIMYEVHFY